MPTGPGDDILDAIEAGTADDAVMSKFKIDADQLKSFKSLHYGLSNEKMAYDEISSYYPELESYFKEPKAVAPQANAKFELTKTVEPPSDQDVFKLVQQKAKLGKELTASQDVSRNAKLYGGAAVMANDEASLNKRKEEIAGIDQQLKAAGYDPEAITKSLGDLPDIPGISPKEALQMQQENPQQFDRYKAALKSQYGLLHAIDKKEGAHAANAYLQQYQQLQKSQDYASQRVATKEAIGAVYKYVDNTEDQQKLIKDIVRDKSYGYGVGLPGQEEAVYNDPRIQNMNPYQVTALQFLEDVDPGTAKSYNRLLAFTPEEIKAQEKNTAFMRGYEAKSRDLENMGMNLMRNSLEEKLNTQLKNKDSWTDQDKENYKQTYERYQTLSDDFKEQNKRYPAMAAMDADRLMQDAMGESTKGVVSKTLLGIGENVDDAKNWIGSLLKTPFQNNKAAALDDLELLGDKRLSQLNQYETEGQELFGREFKTVFTGDLKKQVDEIKSNSSFSDDEKQDAITKAILKDNREHVVFAPNDKAGQANFTAKAILNTVSNIASEIVPQIALAYATGGAGNASKLKELSSLFGSTFATAYNDYYTEALEKNVPNPSQYALVHTTIEAGTELIFNDVEKVKKLFGGKLTGKILENVGEEEMKLLSKTGRFALLKETLQKTNKEGLKNAAQEAFEEISGQLAGNIADKKLFNQEVDTTDDVLQTGVTTFVGMLPLAGLGLPFKYNEITRMQKYALYEAAMNPDKYLARVDEDLQNGTITESEAEARKATITRAAKVAKAMNAVKPDGEVMTDNEKTDLLTNEVVNDTVQEQKKNATEETKEKLETVEQKLEKEKNKLQKPKKNESKTKAKAKTQAEGPSVTEQAPVDEGAAEKTQVEGAAAPAGAQEMRYTNPQGTEYVLRGDKLYHVAKDGKETEFADKAMQTKSTQDLIETIKQANQNAVQEQGATGVPVHAPSTNSEALGQGNEIQGPINEAPTEAQEEMKIESEEDLDRELQKVMQNKAPGFEQLAPEQSQPINNKSTENTFDQYYKKAQAVISNLLPGINIHVYDNEDEYYAKEGRPKGSVGFYDPQTNRVAFNLQAINRHGLQRNVFHEILHPIVNQVIGENQEHLQSLYDDIESLKGLPGMEGVWSHMNQYYNRGGKIQKVEAVTEFLALVADGKIDTSNLSEKAITKIIDIVNKILEALGIDKKLSTASDLKRLSDSVIKAFQEQDVEALKSTLGDRLGTDTTTEKVDALSSQDQEDAIRKIIKATPVSISDAKLNERIVAATGMDSNDVQDLIDEIRKPPVQPQWQTPISSVSEESKRVSFAKFERLLEEHKSDSPSWLQRVWESVKNGSAWIDNPFRFITKITEDINKTYGLQNKEVIPLGRQFEKTAGGRAALRVDALINEVIRGKIEGHNLGRLKGQRYKDFQKYLAAKRVMDRLNKQQEKQEAGENANRQTGNITYQDAELEIQRLENKYGSLDDFVARGQALQRHTDTMLKNLVASGILSQEAYDAIKSDNDFYAPFAVVQSKLLAQQEKQPVGISGIVKRIKGIDYQLPKTQGDALTMINALGDALKAKIISPEEYFNAAIQILNDVKQAGLIDEATYEKHIASLENPGFQIKDILDAAANMIYKAEGMALRNRMLQRLYAYKASDPQGLFIQDVEGFTPMTLPDGSVRMVPKPLSSIKVEPGMAPIKLRVGGKDVMVAVNKHAAEKLTAMSNTETAGILKVADAVNKIFRATVITLSPGFQVVNFLIDFTRTAMLSRYGPLAGKGLVQPMVNAALFMPQYMEALFHSALGNVGIETKTYKQWMESDSFSKGMFDNLFNNEKRIKEVNAPIAKRILMDFLRLKFIEVPGSILEQTHKLATFQRGMSVEGFKPEMYTALLASAINRNIKTNMTQQELNDGLDRLNYEVQNFAGSPNFPQTHKWMKATSLFLQFFSARVKGEITDYRRVANLLTGKGEGVKLSKQDVIHLWAQFGGSMVAIAMYAWLNNAGDDDEKEFNGLPPYHQDNYLNIPGGYFEWEDENGQSHHLRDYAKMPLRGLTATMNVMANSFVRFYKRHNPEEFKKAALAFAGNASPVNLNGKDTRELGESLASNLTPIFKYFIEYSFNRDTHNHRDIVPDFVTGKGMLSKYRAAEAEGFKGDLKPWDIKTNKTPSWAITMSKFLYDHLGIAASPIELDHMENTMGNPTELYDNALKKRLFRSEMKYPLYVPKDIPNKHTSSATITPVTE